MTVDTEALRRSVTKDDYNTTPQPAILYIWGVPFQRQQYDLPAWHSRERDEKLRATLSWEPLWGGAIAKAVTKLTALGWTLEDETQAGEAKKRRVQDLLHAADLGAGWVPFMSKVLADFLTTNNGAFVEIVRAAGGAGARILGLVHLDSLRCTRTGNADVPVIYRDRMGREHYLKSWQVLTFSDMPDPGEMYHGVGHCAAERCYPTIARQAAMNTYLLEKMTGDGATEMEFIQGLGPQQMESVVATGDEGQRQRRAIYYKGKIIVPIMGDEPVSGYRVQLKNVPDGFDPAQLRQQAAQDYSNNIGIPVQDLIPLSGQGLGTGTQTLILAEDAEGQGLAAFRQNWLFTMNEWVTPASTTFSWTNQNDTRDRKAQAEAEQAEATVLGTLVESGIISTQEAKQIAVDKDLIPRSFVPDDAIPGGELSSNEKPTSETGEDEQALLQRLLTQTPVPPPPAQPAQVAA